MHLGQSILFYQQSNILTPPSVFKKISNYIFRFDEKIGEGNFSKVYKGHHQLTNQTVAIKIIQLSSIKSAKLQELLFSEIQVIQSLNHPNILKCHEVLRSDHNCYIITELCDGGDLQTLLKKNNFLSQHAAIPYLKNIYQGLLYLGERGIVHRDLKIANIFMHRGVAKIADFGFAKYTNNQNFKDMDIGSPLYMSPQGMIDHIYGMKTDIWSFGIIIYELLHGCNPFGRCQTQYQLKNAVLVPLQSNSFRADISREVINLMQKCLQINYQARPNASALLSDQFINSILNKGHNQVAQQKKLQWADHIAQTNYYTQTSQPRTKKYPGSQQKIFIEGEDNITRFINRSHNTIPNGEDSSFSRQPIQQMNGQNQLKYGQQPQMNFAQTKNSPSRFLNVPQVEKRLASPNNSESNINYRSNQAPSQSYKNSVNSSFSGKPSYIKSSHITPSRKEELHDTTIMNSHQTKNKNQLSGSKNSNDSWASHNPNSNSKKAMTNLNMPRGSYQEETLNRGANNLTQPKNLQFLINQNRLELQKKQQAINASTFSNKSHTNYNANNTYTGNKDTIPSNFMLNSVPVNRSPNYQKPIQKFQFSSGKKFGQLIKGEKRIPQGKNNQQYPSGNYISSNKQLKEEQKMVKSKSYILDKPTNLSVYTSKNPSNISTSLHSPAKNNSQTNSNFFPRQKQYKSVINNSINQRIENFNGNIYSNVDNIQKNNVVSTVIQFKQAVGLLHYCRLLFRFITTLRKLKLILTDAYVKNQVHISNISFLASLNKNVEQQEILSRYLITVLDQLLKKIKLKGIIYEGDSYKKKQLKQTKLIEVAEEYLKKYVKQINRNRKGRQIIAVYDASTNLQFFKVFCGQLLFNLQKAKSYLEDNLKFIKGYKQNNSKTGQVSIQLTNLCYLGIRLCQSTEVIQKCFLHKNYVQLSNLTIQNWLAQQNYSKIQYQSCLRQRQKSIKLLISLIKGSQTNDTQQNNRNFNDIQ